MPNPFEADVMTPDLITSSWYTDLERGTMWTQHFIYFTKTRHVEQTGVELCTLYVNLRDNFSLAAHHREKGVHVTMDTNQDFPVAPFNKLVVNFPAEPQKYDWDAKPVVLTKSDRLKTVHKVSLGSSYGEWTYDASRLNSKSIVYSVGVGEDTSWDEALLRRHPGLRIWAFDPTPRAAEHVKRKRYSSDQNEDILLRDRFHFTPEGLTAKEDVHVEKFTKPLDPAHISMKEGEFSDLGEVVEVNVSTLKHWLEQFNRERFDILKMDIEGTEYSVLEKCLEDDFFPFDQLLLEWHGFETSETGSRRQKILDALTKKGFISIAESSGSKEMSFIRAPVDSTTYTGMNALSTSLVDASKPKPEIKSEKKEKTAVLELKPTPKSETMPSLKENKLTIGAAKGVAKKNNEVIILQLLNEGYITMTLSWICNVRQFDVLRRTLFVATDRAAYDALREFDSKLQVILRPYESKQELDYGQHEYFAYMLFRTRLIVDLLESGVTVWLVESDAVWLQDPTPIVLGTTADIVAMNDERPPLIVYQGGFHLTRPTDSSRRVWKTLYGKFEDLLKTSLPGAELGDTGSEQLLMDGILKSDENLIVHWLDPELFKPGIYYQDAEVQLEEVGHQKAVEKTPVLILNNWIIGNKAKIARAKRWGHWYLIESQSSLRGKGAQCKT
jgi:FkbM family methyltransferase